MAARSRDEIQARVCCKAACCLRSFKSKEGMRQHFRDSHLQAGQSSSMNHKKVPSSSSLTPPLKMLACSQCGATFRDHRDLHQHQLSSPNHRKVSGPRVGGKLSCNECKALFESSVSLDQHYLVKHPVASLKDDSERQEVLSRFIRKWSHPGRRPIVMDVLGVYNPGHRARRFYEHRDKLIASRGSTDERIRRDGNEVVRYHGTSVLCGLGTGQGSLCSDLACSLCSIIQNGFKKKFADVQGFLRFGLGIYVTATSSKANDYVKAYSSNAPVGRRSMLVCRVLAGKTFKVTKDIPDLVAPPNGYDSVCGEEGPELNYDELVVYDNASILPDYIIVYDLQ